MMGGGVQLLELVINLLAERRRVEVDELALVQHVTQQLLLVVQHQRGRVVGLKRRESRAAVRVRDTGTCVRSRRRELESGGGLPRIAVWRSAEVPCEAAGTAGWSSGLSQQGPERWSSEQRQRAARVRGPADVQCRPLGPSHVSAGGSEKRPSRSSASTATSHSSSGEASRDRSKRVPSRAARKASPSCVAAVVGPRSMKRYSPTPQPMLALLPNAPGMISMSSSRTPS